MCWLCTYRSRQFEDEQAAERAASPRAGQSGAIAGDRFVVHTGADADERAAAPAPVGNRPGRRVAR
ncbi:MAG: hypothetical protein SFW09_10995 [Hyphomicrobiaceae bacterium]|nr:hypothetical protein [Hyphomicrobiaceae bacterium]